VKDTTNALSCSYLGLYPRFARLEYPDVAWFLADGISAFLGVVYALKLDTSLC